jgi:hypothetical protein
MMNKQPIGIDAFAVFHGREIQPHPYAHIESTDGCAAQLIRWDASTIPALTEQSPPTCRTTTPFSCS